MESEEIVDEFVDHSGSSDTDGALDSKTKTKTPENVQPAWQYKAKVGRPGFQELFVDGRTEPVAELQPIPYSGATPGGRFAIRCKVKGHKACSRGKTFHNFGGPDSFITEEERCTTWLAEWVVKGLHLADKEAHMGLPRD